MAEKILIVEDDYSLREALGDALAEAGYTVVTAQDAETGILLFEAEAPDLAVLDMTLPGMSGTYLCELIRKSSRIPVIMFTGHNEVQLVNGAITRGATDYVLKESGVLELITRIGYHLAPKTATAVIAAALAQKRRLPIMIADPDPDSRDKLLDAVKRLNYVDAQETETGEQTLKELAVAETRLVLLEIDMPDISGFELLKAVSAVPGRPEVSIVIVSRKRPPEFHRKLRYNNILGYVDRPLNPVLLDNSLRAAMEGANVRSSGFYRDQYAS